MSDIAAISTSGLIAAQTDVAVVASNVANSTDATSAGTPAPFGSSAIASAPATVPQQPLSGAQPNGAAAQVFQALSAANSESSGGGVTTTVTTGSDVLSPTTTQDLTALNAASTAYQSNILTLQAANNITNQSLSLSV